MLDLNILQQFAVTNGLSLKNDVFHSAVGLELRKITNQGIIGVGFIKGKDETEVYARKFNRLDLLLHEKIWWLGNIFHLFGYNPANNYRCIKKMPNVDFNKESFIALAKKGFNEI